MEDFFVCILKESGGTQRAPSSKFVSSPRRAGLWRIVVSPIIPWNFPSGYDSAMRNLVVLSSLPWPLALGHGGVRPIVAESSLLKHKLLHVNRSRQRSPNIRASDHTCATSIFASANSAEGRCCRSNSLGADYGGRDRTGDPLLAKNRSPLQRLRPLFWFPMFSTIWGICFSLTAKPNAMKTFDSCTVANLHRRSKCSSVDQNVCV
jgi:hypothetical protein